MGDIQRTLYVEINKAQLSQNSINAGGTVDHHTYGPVPLGEYWFIERIFVHSSTAGTPKVYVLVRDPGGTGVDYSDGMDFTNNGKDDIADETKDIVMFPGQTMRLRWEGLAAADQQASRIQYSVRRPVYVTMPEYIDVRESEDVYAVE